MSEQEQIQVQDEREQQPEQEEEEYSEIIDVLAQQILEENEEKYARRRWLKRLRKMGIVIGQIYHCKRCNHLWLPKDYDASFNKTEYVDQSLEHRQPPKACARCKSRPWNLPPKRKTKHTIEDVKDKNIFQGIIGNNEKIKLFGHDMLTAQRLKLVDRLIRKREIEVEEATKHLEENAKEFKVYLEKRKEEERRKTPEQIKQERLENKKRVFEAKKQLQQKEEERERAEQLQDLKKKILLQSKKDPDLLALLAGAKEEYEKEKENNK